jgi:hypothetical protein
VDVAANVAPDSWETVDIDGAMSRMLLSSTHHFISYLELVDDTDYTAAAVKAQQDPADPSTAFLVAVAKKQQDKIRIHISWLIVIGYKSFFR